MKLWIARNKIGWLQLFFEQPKYREDWEGRFITYLIDDDCFNEVTFENSPQEVELKLCNNE